MNRNTWLLTLAMSLALGFVAWRVHATRNVTVNHAALLLDPSLSYKGGCPAAVGIAERVMNMDAFSPGSTLSALALGDQFTANEPRRFAKYSLPKTHKVIEGRNAALRHQHELLADLRQKCTSVHPTMISPIFLGIKQSIAELRSLGCGAESNCYLYVSSDGEENGEPSIRRALEVSKSNNLPAPLNNLGIRIVFCGLAETAGRIVDPSGREVRTIRAHDPEHNDRLRSVWLSLFTKPEAVEFEPYCPQPADIDNSTSPTVARRKR